MSSWGQGLTVHLYPPKRPRPLRNVAKLSSTSLIFPEAEDDPKQRRYGTRAKLPKGQCLQAAFHKMTSAYLDSSSPGIITFHVQEFVHVYLQLWDLLFLG